MISTNCNNNVHLKSSELGMADKQQRNDKASYNTNQPPHVFRRKHAEARGDIRPQGPQERKDAGKSHLVVYYVVTREQQHDNHDHNGSGYKHTGHVMSVGRFLPEINCSFGKVMTRKS